jgi:two-component system, chemotaxis family, chemotaxis protein CheY
VSMSQTELRILLADQSAFYRGAIREYILPGLFPDIHETQSALDTVALLLSQPFDLFVVDWDLLTTNDGALMELIVRRAKTIKRKMPVLAMMASPTRSSVMHASSNGIDMVLRKPFSPKLLQERTRWLLDQVKLEMAI